MTHITRPTNRFKVARKAAGLTQAEMARLLEIPKRSIENWEGDKSAPPGWVEKLLMKELQRIADARNA